MFVLAFIFGGVLLSAKKADAFAAGAFVTTWKTNNPGTSASNQITIPTNANTGGYNYNVDWGDSTTSTGVAGDITHTYAIAGTYQVSITGAFPSILLGSGIDSQKILSVDQWGTIVWTIMASSFAGTNNLVINATDTPNLSAVTNMDDMFYSATNFNSPLNSWDVSHVTSMDEMFYRASSFNQPLNSWNVSNVTDTGAMFANATNFNQDISAWNVSNVTYMTGMFSRASSFNQPLNSWNVSHVTDMGSMFANATNFNQDISAWNVSNVTNMNGMFNSVTLSTANYDALLASWSLEPLKSNVSFSAGQSKYSASAQQRAYIISTYNWAITDGGLFSSDSIAPTGSITINNNAVYANSGSMTFNLSATDAVGVTGYYIAQDPTVPTISTPGWVAVTPTTNFSANPVLNIGVTNGVRTMNVWYKDAAGNISTTYSDSIILDTTFPTGSIVINGNAASTNSTASTLTLTCSDTGSGCGQMQFSNDNVTYSAFETFATTKAWSLSAGDGTKTVYLKLKDVAGNISPTYSDTIVLATIAPDTTITSSPANPSNSASATFTFTSTIANSTFACNLDGAGYTACTSPKDYSGLSEGAHTFSVKAADQTGNSDLTPANFSWSISLLQSKLVFNGGTANCVIIGTDLSCTVTATSGNVYALVLPLSTVPTVGNSITINIIENGSKKFGLQVTNATIPTGTTKSISIARPDGNNIDLCVNDTPGADFLQEHQKCSSPAVPYKISGNVVDPFNPNIIATNTSFTISGLVNSVVEASSIVDTDGDGVLDNVDQCPTVPGSVFAGCPFSDITNVTTHIAGAKNTGECGLKNDGKNANECKVPTAGVVVKVFDRANPDFIAAFVDPKHPNAKPKKETFDNIFESDLGNIAQCTTDSAGTCQVGEDHAGKFIVITKLIDGSTSVYAGKFKEFKKQLRADADDEQDDNDETANLSPKYFTLTKSLHFQKTINDKGVVKYNSAESTVVMGSRLDILHPDYIVWENDTQLYPFTLTSDSDWTTDICLSVPAGYKVTGVLDADGNIVAASNCTQTFISGESKTYLFSVADIGSPEPTFGLSITTTHKGKKEKHDLTVEGVRRKTKNVTDKDLKVKVEKAKKVKEDRESKKGKKVAVAPKVKTLWGAVKIELVNAPTDTVKAAVKEVAKRNDIAIPEWGINGRLNSRALKASVLDSIDFSFLSNLFR